ncbi:MAG: transglycosylase SLT domain-containing protein [Thermodesulfobacteriota bacterium]
MRLEKHFVNRNATPIRRMELRLLQIFVLGLLFFPVPALAENVLLKEIIVAYNQRQYGESLEDGSYRGEEGILKIGPEVARSLGLKAVVDHDYQEGRESFQRGDRFLEKARGAMSSTRKESAPMEHAQQILESFLSYKKAVEAGRQRLMHYRSRLNPQMDERLNDTLGSQLMDRLLNESLKRTDNRLRDALAIFYNLCHGLHTNEYVLAAENVHFVNEVFRQFVFRASKEALALFDLDRQPGQDAGNARRDWKKALERQDGQYAGHVEAAMQRHGASNFPVDPLLFVALMKRESAFEASALSRVGAAGLTQIMPQTALELGMKGIFKPEYFDRLLLLTEKERRLRGEAMGTLFRISLEDGLETASRARDLMQESIQCAQEKEKLLTRYRSELLQHRDDDRFKPSQAIDFGFKYFSRFMREHDGDISLALASYNAGPHRVREYHGIPPFGETILFRNKVLEFYREYLRKAQERQ